MALNKVTYVDGQTIIMAQNLNDIQDEIIANATDIAAKQPMVKSKDITLAQNGWAGNGPYTQAVTITGYTVTAATRVDLYCDAATLAQLIDDGVEAVYISNTNGTLTAYATGAMPTADITVTAATTEVTAI